MKIQSMRLENYRGQGLGKGIVGLLATKIFALPGALRIIVQPDSANGPSCGALLGNGFVFDSKNSLYYKL